MHTKRWCAALEKVRTRPFSSRSQRPFSIRGMILGGMNRAQDALGALEEVVSRFGQSTDTALLEPVANAIVYRGDALDRLNRPEDALAAWDDVLLRFGTV